MSLARASSSLAVGTRFKKPIVLTVGFFYLYDTLLAVFVAFLAVAILVGLLHFLYISTHFSPFFTDFLRTELRHDDTQTRG